MRENHTVQPMDMHDLRRALAVRMNITLASVDRCCTAAGRLRLLADRERDFEAIDRHNRGSRLTAGLLAHLIGALHAGVEGVL